MNIPHIGDLKKDNVTVAPWNVTWHLFIIFYCESFGWSIVLLLQG